MRRAFLTLTMKHFICLMVALCAIGGMGVAQTPNPLAITSTIPNQFQLSWLSANHRPYQVEGGPDLVNWAEVGPIIVGTGATQGMLVTATNDKFFFRLREGAMRPGFNAIAMAAADDHTYPQYEGPPTKVDFGFTINFLGTLYSSCYVNNNGNITFDESLEEYTPGSLEYVNRVIMAPFWADVDTRNLSSNVTSFSAPDGYVSDKSAFGVTYQNVGYFDVRGDKLNSFQMILINRQDTGINNFDLEFNYNKIIWETGDRSGGTDGLGGASARIGFGDGAGTFTEVAGSGVPSTFLDSNQTTGLKYKMLGSNIPGRLIFRFRNGSPEGSFTVSAGPNQMLSSNQLGSFQLSGSVNPPNIPGITYEWTEIYGPFDVASISDSTILNPTVSITGLGTRRFRLTATAMFDSVRTAVSSIVEIGTPTLEVSAGENMYIEYPAPLSIQLQGAASFSEGGNVSVTWIQLGGEEAVMSSPNSLSPTVTLPGPGVYYFGITATTGHSPPFVQSSEVTVEYYQE